MITVYMHMYHRIVFTMLFCTLVHGGRLRPHFSITSTYSPLSKGRSVISSLLILRENLSVSTMLCTEYTDTNPFPLFPQIMNSWPSPKTIADSGDCYYLLCVLLLFFIMATMYVSPVLAPVVVSTTFPRLLYPIDYTSLVPAVPVFPFFLAKCPRITPQPMGTMSATGTAILPCQAAAQQSEHGAHPTKSQSRMPKNWTWFKLQ